MPKQPKNTNGRSKPVAIHFTKVIPKGRSIRFEVADDNFTAPITQVYVNKSALGMAGVTEGQITGMMMSFEFLTGDK